MDFRNRFMSKGEHVYGSFSRKFRLEYGDANGAGWVLILTFFFTVAFGFWATQSKIDELAKARGQVVSTAKTQVIQSVDGGVLSELLVREGQIVTAGQVLARLDSSRARAAVEDSQAKVAALRSTLVRLKAEVFGTEPIFGQDFSKWPAFIENQLALFQRRQRVLHEGVSALESVLSNVRLELAINLKLQDKGDVSSTEVLRLKRQEAEIMGQMVNLRNKYFQEAQAEMTKAEEELATQEQILSDRMTLLEHTQICAPMAGIVKLLPITTIGAALRAGDVVVELVPSTTEFIVEAKFSPSDVALLRVGLPASIKFDAFDYGLYGQALGEVSYISADTIAESDPRLVDRYYYRVNVRILELSNKLVRGQRMQVQPGMTSQVEVRTGQRSVFQFLSKPITKTLTDSLTER